MILRIPFAAMAAALLALTACAPKGPAPSRAAEPAITVDPSQIFKNAESP